MTSQLWVWAKQNGTGRSFDSSNGFHLPRGADRSPDASWVPLTQLAALTPEQWRSILPLCPPCVVEIMSPSDRLRPTRDKMAEWITNGARLGVLINPKRQQVSLYRADQEPLVLDNPQSVLLEPKMPGFTLSLSDLWMPS